MISFCSQRLLPLPIIQQHQTRFIIHTYFLNNDIEIHNKLIVNTINNLIFIKAVIKHM